MKRNDAELRRLAEASTGRVARLELGGQTYWVKRREDLSLRMRLQKGDAAQAFEAERDAYRALARIGAPVPEIVAEGDGYFVTPDCGEMVSKILAEQSGTLESRLKLFETVAVGLWAFHEKGVSHGRPSLKDICWDGARVRFLDFERYGEKRNTERGHAEDLVMIVFNALAIAQKPCPEVDHLIETYRSLAPDAYWERARALCKRMRWMDWATKPIQMRREGRAKEFKAIPLTLKAFAVR